MDTTAIGTIKEVKKKYFSGGRIFHDVQRIPIGQDCSRLPFLDLGMLRTAL
jgi:hypothetical protein